MLLALLLVTSSAFAGELPVRQTDGDRTFTDPKLNVDAYWPDAADTDNSELLIQVFGHPNEAGAYYHKQLGRTGSGVEGLGPPGGGGGLVWGPCTGAMISRIQHPGWVQTLVPGWYRNPHYIGRNHGAACARID